MTSPPAINSDGDETNSDKTYRCTWVIWQCRKEKGSGGKKQCE